MKVFSSIQIAAYHTQLLNWFASNQRDFPWRHYNDPYAILLAEKILQQTAARPAAVNAYQKLLTTYPHPALLAVADIAYLHTIFRPIGLLYRARELPQLAAEIIGRHEGRVPDSLSELLALTGVGSYTARAVLSFAYRKDIAVVDTNVSRILYRIFSIPGPKPANPARKRILLELSDSLLPPGNSREYNFAVLDLSALICKNKNPLCCQCPLLALCNYGMQANKPTSI